MKPRYLWTRVVAAPVITLVLVLVLAATPAQSYTYYPPFPQGDIGISRPLIGQYLVLPPGESFDGADMWLDGSWVPATWNPETGCFSYTPDAPLTPGHHRVKISVRVRDARPGYTFDPLVSEFWFTVAPGALDVLPGPAPEAAHALAYLNAQRTAAGLPAVAWYPALGAAASMHARYLTANPGGDAHGDVHKETRGLPFFTGVTAWDRAAYYGYHGAVSEVIAYEGWAEAAVRGWLATPYHRLPLVHPGNVEFGYGWAGEAQPLEVMKGGPGLEDGAPTTIRWPYDGQVGVLTSWPGLETPDPLRLYPGTSGPVGYTVSLTFVPEPLSLRLTSAAFTDPQGRAVECMTFFPEKDVHLRSTVALIPFRPLEAWMTYRVAMTGTVDQGSGSRPFNETWTFTTGPGELETGPALKWSWRSEGQRVTVDFGGVWLRQGISAYLDGLPVRNLSVRSRTSISFDVPTGFQGAPAPLLLVTSDGLEKSFTLSGGLGRSLSSAWTETTVQLPGSATQTRAYSHVGGAIMVPERSLSDIGATSFTVPVTGRTYWTLRGTTGGVTSGSLLAYMDGSPLRLPLPVQDLAGERFVPLEFVRRLVIAAGSLLDLAGHWAEGDVTRLVEMGIVSGMGDGTFRPEATLVRAQFLKMLVMARGLPLQPGDPAGFSDTPGHWVSSQGYVAPALGAAIIRSGEYPGSLFLPDRDITREEIAVMVVRAMGLEAEAERRAARLSGPLAIGGKVFSDAVTWSRPGYVAVAVENGIVAGYLEPDGTYTFRPAGAAKRAEAAVMVVRMLDWAGGNP
jgi:hypothetical protein